MTFRLQLPRVERRLAVVGSEPALGIWHQDLRQVEPDVTLGAHLLDVGVDQSHANQRFVFDVELGVGHAHGLRQPSPEFGVGNRLSQWSDGRFVPTEIEMTPRRDHIDMFEFGGGRKDDVGIAGSVGEKLLAYDGEQILALEAAPGQVSARYRHQRVPVPDKQRFDAIFQQRSTEMIHRDFPAVTGNVES